MRRRSSSFDYGEGKYYFTIKTHPNNITIHRKNKMMAIAAFFNYKQSGKEIEWHGKWNGKSFVETSLPEQS